MLYVKKCWNILRYKKLKWLFVFIVLKKYIFIKILVYNL